MRTIVSVELEAGRIREGQLASDASYGLTGAFTLIGPHGATLGIIASDGLGWEHVSVSLRHRTPNWPEMCFVKDLFWRQDETVLQFHPRSSEYVNFHPHCLHLWKKIGSEIELPPRELIA